MNVKMYSVPEAIVSELNLKDYRQSDGKGNYVLSSRDLRCYGIDKAISEGAVLIQADEEKQKFNK